MKVLVACEYSGRVRESFAKLGHDVLSCDLLPTEIDGNHYQGDVRDLLYQDWDLMIAFPPCTRLTNSGVRWLHVPPSGKTKQQMWADLDSAADFYKLLRDAPIPKKAIENPIMHCYAIERINPGIRQIVQPHWFGDAAFKATGFELIGLSQLIPTNKLVPPEKGDPEYKSWSKVHLASPGIDRWKDRSRTFPGIALAMAEQWG